MRLKRESFQTPLGIANLLVHMNGKNSPTVSIKRDSKITMGSLKMLKFCSTIQNRAKPDEAVNMMRNYAKIIFNNGKNTTAVIATG